MDEAKAGDIWLQMTLDFCYVEVINNNVRTESLLKLCARVKAGADQLDLRSTRTAEMFRLTVFSQNRDGENVSVRSRKLVE